jgi:peptidoglycan/LPS O-acetylase OafA/YrhL
MSTGIPVGAEPAAPSPRRQRYEALDALRGVAVLMVVYDHLFAVAGERMAGGPFAPTAWVREWITQPLGIIQDFGWLGVCLFFLISGFVITHSARRETVRVFALRRVFRILPPLAAAVLLVAALDLAAGVRRPWSDYFFGMTLAGYFTVPQVIVLGVAWTLVIEVLFYFLMALVSPLLKGDKPAFGIAVASTVPLLAIVFARDFGASFFLFAASMAYLPVLLIGSTFYLRQATATGPGVVAALLLANVVIFMLGLRSIHTAFLPIDNSYLVSLAYTVAILLPCLDRRAPRALKFFGDSPIRSICCTARWASSWSSRRLPPAP